LRIRAAWFFFLIYRALRLDKGGKFENKFSNRHLCLSFRQVWNEFPNGNRRQMTSYTKVMVIIMKNKKKKKNKKWIRPRHALVRGLLNITLGVYARKKYGAKIRR